jgi:hypothetical protein
MVIFEQKFHVGKIFILAVYRYHDMDKNRQDPQHWSNHNVTSFFILGFLTAVAGFS